VSKGSFTATLVPLKGPSRLPDREGILGMAENPMMGRNKCLSLQWGGSRPLQAISWSTLGSELWTLDGIEPGVIRWA